MRQLPAEALAAISRGRKVQIVGGQERATKPPVTPEEKPVQLEPAHPEDSGIARVADALCALTQKVDAAVEAFDREARAVSESNARVSADLATVARTMAMPVRPVYSKDGKIIGARRVETLGG